jgi:hypothetical protein
VATSDGLHFRWRETAPDQGLLTFALSQLDDMHGSWPDPVQCNIIVERSPVSATASEGVRPSAPCEPSSRYRAHVEIKLGRRTPSVLAKATGDDPYAALRRAFGDLRHCMPVPATPATAPVSGEVAA